MKIDFIYRQPLRESDLFSILLTARTNFLVKRKEGILLYMAKLEYNSTTMDHHLPTKTFLISAIILKCLLGVFGIVGNVGMIVYNLVKHSKTPTDYLIINLGIADLTTCATYYPTFVVEFGRIVSGVAVNRELFCRIIAGISSSTVSLSVITLLAITLDRYYFITTPLKYPVVITRKRVFVIIATIWFSALLLACLVVSFTTASDDRLNCPVDYTVTIFGVVIFVHIPTALVLYLNYKVFKVARNHRRRIAQQRGIAQSSISQSGNTDHNRTARSSFRRAFKSIKTFAIVTGVFVLCYIPFSITLIVGTFLCQNHCVPVELSIIFGDLVSLSSVLNPFIYNMRQHGVFSCR